MSALTKPTQSAGVWLALTPAGALQAFAQRQPDEPARALQALLSGAVTLTQAAWLANTPGAPALLEPALASGWIERLPRCIEGPEVRLDDFVPHVIASLSGERRAVSHRGRCGSDVAGRVQAGDRLQVGVQDAAAGVRAWSTAGAEGSRLDRHGVERTLVQPTQG